METEVNGLSGATVVITGGVKKRCGLSRRGSNTTDVKHCNLSTEVDNGILSAVESEL